MLDGECYSSNFSDDGPDGESRLLLSEELLVALKAIEREISQFMLQHGGTDGPTLPRLTLTTSR